MLVWWQYFKCTAQCLKHSLKTETCSFFLKKIFLFINITIIHHILKLVQNKIIVLKVSYLIININNYFACLCLISCMLCLKLFIIIKNITYSKQENVITGSSSQCHSKQWITRLRLGLFGIEYICKQLLSVILIKFNKNGVHLFFNYR